MRELVESSNFPRRYQYSKRAELIANEKFIVFIMLLSIWKLYESVQLRAQIPPMLCKRQVPKLLHQRVQQAKA